MNRAITIAAVVLALGAFACERKNEQQPSGTTTSGTMGLAGGDAGRTELSAGDAGRMSEVSAGDAGVSSALSAGDAGIAYRLSTRDAGAL